MLQPKRTKFRKMQKGRVKGRAVRGSRVAFGDYGIKALEPGWITSRQIEAARIAMTRHMKRIGKVWIRIFPDKPITKKPAETRMGKGKGAPEHFVAVVKPGRILFEIGGVPEDLAHEALRLAIQKLPLRCKIAARPELTPVPIPGRDASEAAEAIVAYQPSQKEVEAAEEAAAQMIQEAAEAEAEAAAEAAAAEEAEGEAGDEEAAEEPEATSENEKQE